MSKSCWIVLSLTVTNNLRFTHVYHSASQSINAIAPKLPLNALFKLKNSYVKFRILSLLKKKGCTKITKGVKKFEIISNR